MEGAWVVVTLGAPSSSDPFLLLSATTNCIFVCCGARFDFLVAFATAAEQLHLLALSKGKKEGGG